MDTYAERFEYLKMNAAVGDATFGKNRYLNQTFYSSYEWRKLRDHIILRDNGCDLGVPGMEIHGRVYIHHINPIDESDIVQHSNSLMDPNNLICVSMDTHNAIHFGTDNVSLQELTIRTPNDTCPWKQ